MIRILPITGYHRASPASGNKGGIYRNDGVDIYKDSSAYERYYVGSIEDGEWLQYTIAIKDPGNYVLTFLISSESGNGKIIVMDNNGSSAKTVSIPSTGSYKKWAIVKIENMSFGAGIHKLKIAADTGGFNLKEILFSKKN